MLKDKLVAVVVPAYNEETQIETVITTMPDFVDRIIVVNDCSKDTTAKKVMALIEVCGQRGSIPQNEKNIEPTFFNRALIAEQEMLKKEAEKYPRHAVYNDNDKDRLVLINNLENAKVGGAISVGYKWCRDHSIDCTAVMAGDAQMDPDELEGICNPVICERIDYVKGNRLSHKTAKIMIPGIRRFGNSVLSALTKIASGYWRVSDTQTGYTAISLQALYRIDLWNIYRNYGMPNDMLIKLNIAKCTLREVDIKPVYAIGEQSKMKIGKVIPSITGLLVGGFFKRIFIKYFLNDFHPVFFFYFFGMLSAAGGLYFAVRYIIKAMLLGTTVTTGTYLGFVLFIMTTIFLNGFAMWIDMYDNDKLYK